MQLRHILVQLPDETKPRASTLGRAVHERKHRALLLYLLVLTCWPWLEDRRDPLEAGVWIRALTPPRGTKGPTWSKSTLSRAWADLELLGLVEHGSRNGRRRVVTPRREDGKAKYEPARGRSGRLNAYFTIPDAFWLEGIFAKLSLPGLAMLLIIAKETNSKPEMYLPYEQAPAWYGISAKTAQNGIADLRRHNLLHERIEPVTAELSGIGWTIRTHYALTGEFGHEARAAQRKLAKKERAKRIKKVVQPKGATTSRRRSTVGEVRDDQPTRTKV
jgi:hypothetical protein